MAFALLGLIAFQAYWLGFMLETKKEQFAADVRSSLDQVVRKLEKQELFILAQKQKKLEAQQEKLASITQKLSTKPKPVKAPQEPVSDQLALAFANENLDLQHSFQEEIPNDIVYVRKSILLPNGQVAEITEQYEVNNQVENITRRLREEQQLNELFNGNQPKILKELNRIKNRRNKPLARQREKVLNAISKMKKAGQERIQNLQGNVDKEKAEKQELQKVLKKTEMAKEVFADFLFKERPIEQRVSPSYIDSLIKRELKEKQIDLPYVFGIGSNQKQKPWVFASSPSLKRPEVQQAAFISPLFPNDLTNTGHVLEVFFPAQKAYIWQTMGLSLVASGMLLLIMLACFYVAVNTILRQKKLAEVKNDFINNMTHEFKTPISTISLATQLIQDEPQVAKNENILRYLGIIKDENIRLGSQVERVLQTAQMEKETVILKKRTLDMHNLIQQIVAINDPLLQANHGKVTLFLQANPSLLPLDEVHISNVLNNLLDNAIKYSLFMPSITIATESRKGEFLISVTDQGIGMAKDVLGSVFEPFYRVPTGNVHNVKGFGLGLSYVKKIVEAHGGQVSVKSKLGEGSTFEISLPYGNE
jgi:two-component system, OmpR family, phosphate regulon sensor histidine kinase PhoR